MLELLVDLTPTPLPLAPGPGLGAYKGAFEESQEAAGVKKEDTVTLPPNFVYVKCGLIPVRN